MVSAQHKFMLLGKPKSYLFGATDTERDFDSLSGCFLSAAYRPGLSGMCGTDKLKPDGSERIPSSQPVQGKWRAVLSNATVVSDPPSKLQIKVKHQGKRHRIGARGTSARSAR